MKRIPPVIQRQVQLNLNASLQEYRSETLALPNSNPTPSTYTDGQSSAGNVLKPSYFELVSVQHRENQIHSAEMERSFLKVPRVKQSDENVLTNTSFEQAKVEDTIEKLFTSFNKRALHDASYPKLNIKEHIKYLKQSLSFLPQNHSSLDSSRAWLCYWVCHSMRLLDYDLESNLKSHVANFLKNCQCPEGGFGGGPGQAAHLASTYAAVNALCCLDTEEALEIIDREKLKQFLWRTKCSSGAFSLEINGETDIRGAYCAVSVATLLNIDTTELFENTAQWIVSCQTYEGGFSGYPGLEAHGGYTFCGIAALVLLNSVHLGDMKALLRWCVNRQTPFEGGFQGRTNKLVDVCYSFWVGGVFPIIYSVLNRSGSGDNCSIDEHLFNNQALQEYILICCQHHAGGLLDKPEKPRDAYHTCYGLSGLSIAQHTPNLETDIISDEIDTLKSLHPLYNIEQECLRHVLEYYSRLPTI